MVHGNPNLSHRTKVAKRRGTRFRIEGQKNQSLGHRRLRMTLSLEMGRRRES